MGWTEVEAASASLEYVLELAADMALEAESMRATSSTSGQLKPGKAKRFVSKRE